MFSYVFMKILEGRPRSYDKRMHALSGGRVLEAKRAVLAALPPSCHVLEIGSGAGELSSMAAEQGHTVVGFDLSKEMVRAARRRIKEDGPSDRVSFRRMGVDGMDELADRSYDAVISTLVFSELGQDERRFALENAARVLKPGGLLVIADEVVPRKRSRRLAHSLVRTPMLALTYLASGSSTTPLAQLPSELAAAGFTLQSEQRSHGDAFAVFNAHLAEKEQVS